MIASSTTRPIASTNDNSVSRLIVKPKANIIMKVPISDTGIAIAGITTERNEPRNRKTTKITMTIASTRLRTTSRIELFTKSVKS